MAIRDRWDTLLQKSMGTPVLKGTLTSPGTSVNNTDTAVPFLNSSTVPSSNMIGKMYAFQARQAGYLIPITSSAGTVASTTGVYLSAGDVKTIDFADGYPFVAWISADGGAADCIVLELI